MNPYSGSGQVVKRMICAEIISKYNTYECDLAFFSESRGIAITPPGRERGRWEYVRFRINVLTGVITLACYDYPTDDRYPARNDYSTIISAEQFCEYANIFNMDPALKQMRTKSDWESILNCAEVQEIIANKKERELQKEKDLIEQCAIRIPKNITNNTPSMDYSFEVMLFQRFGDTSFAMLNCIDSKYYVKTRNKVRELTTHESIWIEKYIEEVIADSNTEKYQSYGGGDSMHVSIKKGGHVIGNDSYGIPYMKYNELLDKARTLAEYGSILIEEPMATEDGSILIEEPMATEDVPKVKTIVKRITKIFKL